MASDMVVLYESGASVRKVAEAFNVHRQTVARHLRSAGAQLRSPGLSKDQAEHACELYLSGQTLAQVGERFGVSQGTISRSLRDQGVGIRPPLVRACAILRPKQRRL